jgi:hypothetical protein
MTFQQQAYKYSNQQQIGYVQRALLLLIISSSLVAVAAALQELAVAAVLVDLEQELIILLRLEILIQLQSVLVAGLLLMDHLLFLIRSLQQVVEEVQAILLMELMELLVVLVVAQ